MKIVFLYELGSTEPKNLNVDVTLRKSSFKTASTCPSSSQGKNPV
jgi:hypothetical protein